MINISVAVAVIAVLQFYTALKKDLKHHKPLAKFLAFKLIIFITFVQKVCHSSLSFLPVFPYQSQCTTLTVSCCPVQIIFWILHSTNVLKETSKFTFADINMGLQTMLICIEMVPFSIFFHWAYDVAAYDLTKARPLPLSDITSGNVNNIEAGHAHHGAQSNLPKPMQRAGQEQYTHYKNVNDAYHGGPLGIKAWVSLLDPREIIRAIRFAFVMRSEASKMNRDVLAMGPPPATYYTARR